MQYNTLDKLNKTILPEIFSWEFIPLKKEDMFNQEYDQIQDETIACKTCGVRFEIYDMSYHTSVCEKKYEQELKQKKNAKKLELLLEGKLL